MDSNRRIIIGVSLLSLLLSIAVSSGIAPIQELLISTGCKHYNIDSSSQECKDSDDAKFFASTHLFWLILASYVPQVLGIAGVAHTTDICGRRFGVTLSTTGSAFTSLMIATLPIDYFYSILLPCCFLANFAGGFLCSLGTLFACVADATTTSSFAERQIYFGVIEAIVFIGLLIGPTSAGLLADHFGERQALMLPVIANISGILISLLCLPSFSSHKTTTPTKFCWAKLNPFSAIWNFLFLSRTSIFLGLAMTCALTTASCMTVITPLWLRSTHNFSYTKIGYLQSLLYAVNALGLLIFAPIATRLGMKGKYMIMLSSVSVVAWTLLWTVDSMNLFAAASVCCFSSLTFPVARAAVAAMYKPSEYGSALGVVATLQTMSTCLGAVAAPALLSVIGWRSTFYTCACISTLAIILMLPLPPTIIVSQPKTSTDELSRLAYEKDTNTNTTTTTTTSNGNKAINGSKVRESENNVLNARLLEEGKPWEQK